MKDMFYDWFGLNAWLFQLINSIGNVSYLNFMLWVSRLGDHANFKYYSAVLIVWILAEFGIKRMRKEEIPRADKQASLALLISMVMGFALCGLIVGVLKSMVKLPRPFAVPSVRPGMHFAGPYPNLLDYFATFPSSHAATIAFIVFALWYKFPQPAFRYTGIALIVLVCWARIAVGMQFPADVLAGVLIGWATVQFSRRYVYRIMRVPLPADPSARESMLRKVAAKTVAARKKA